MHLPNDDRRVGKMFQDIGHAHGVETFVAESELRCEIHLRARNACGSSKRERLLVDIDADPSNHSDELDHDSATTPDVQSDALPIMTVRLERFSEKDRLCFIVSAFSPVGSVSDARRFVILLVKLSDQPATPVRFMKKQFLGKVRLAVHIVLAQKRTT